MAHEPAFLTEWIPDVTARAAFCRTVPTPDATATLVLIGPTNKILMRVVERMYYAHLECIYDARIEDMHAYANGPRARTRLYAAEAMAEYPQLTFIPTAGAVHGDSDVDGMAAALREYIQDHLHLVSLIWRQQRRDERAEVRVFASSPP